MVIRTSKKEMNVIIQKFLEYMINNNYIEFLDEKSGDEWVTAEEAAKILHISRDRLYHIKNHLTHRKGNSPKSRLLFLKSSLIEDYMDM